jgi:hypothetical protein
MAQSASKKFQKTNMAQLEFNIGAQSHLKKSLFDCQEILLIDLFPLSVWNGITSVGSLAFCACQRIFVNEFVLQKVLI